MSTITGESCTLLMIICLSFNLQISTAYDAVAVNGSYPKVLPRPTDRQAVGYDKNSNTILIVGGVTSKSAVSFNIDDEQFDDLGADYMSVGTSGNNYYTMINNSLWAINGGGTGFITINTVTYKEHIPSTQFPTAISPHACLASNDNYLLVVGGWNNNAMLHIIQIYDVNNDKWITDAPLMQESRSLCGCIVNNNRLYVIAGLSSDTIEYMDVSGDLNNMTARKWQYATDTLQTTLRGLTAVNYNDQILILGGRTDDVNYIYPTTIPVLDTTTNTIYNAGSLAYGVAQAGCIIVGGRVYIFGGQIDGGQMVTSYQYIDVSTNECVWKVGDNVLNLTHVQGFVLNKISDNNPQQIYSLSPCSNNINCNGESSMVTVGTISNCIQVITRWDQGLTEPVHSNNFDGQWQFVYTNGDGCTNAPQSVVTVFWNCNPLGATATVTAAKEIGTCAFEIQIDSTLACN